MSEPADETSAGAGQRLHVEAVIAPGLARKAAGVVQRDRFLRPIPTGLLVVEVVVAIVLLVLGPPWAGVILLVVAAIGPGVAYATLPKLTAHLAGTGFAPGTELSADYYDQHFVLSTGGSSNTLAYTDFTGLRTTSDLALLRRRGEKVLFLLPVEAVPPEVRDRFARP